MFQINRKFRMLVSTVVILPMIFSMAVPTGILFADENGAVIEEINTAIADASTDTSDAVVGEVVSGPELDSEALHDISDDTSTTAQEKIEEDSFSVATNLSCTNRSVIATVDGASAKLIVPEGACPIKISFSSYSHKGTIRPFEDQVLTDNITDTYGPGTYNLNLGELSCNWQTDIYYGDVQTNLNKDYGHHSLISYDYVENQVCDTPAPVCTFDIVSDSKTIIEGGVASVSTYDDHPDWTANIPGATWIWKTFFVQNPTQDETTTFSRTFKINGEVKIASLVIAADNQYTVSINNNLVGNDQQGDNFFDEKKDIYDIAPYLNSGVNTIVFTVNNLALNDSSPETNPAGLLYKISVTQSGTNCDSDVPVIPPPVDSCINKVPTGSITADGKNATLIIPEGACPIKISFSSYTFEETVRPFDEQVLVDNITDTYGPGTHEIGPIDVACKWQSDLYGGDVQTDLNPDYGHSNLIFSIFDENADCNTPPEITLIGLNPYPITVGGVYNDQGAVAFDLEDGNITSDIITTGTVNTAVVGTYVITYTVTDSGGLSASTTRNVIVNPVDCTSNCGGGSNTPAVTLAANPGSITVGATSTLSWTSTNTNSCSAVWTTATSTSGSQDVAPSITTEYSISCTGTNGTVSATTTVTVTSVPPVNPPGGGGGGSFSGGRRHPVVTGEILGATSCLYLIDYVKIDWVNDPIEVLKVQSFLNVFEGENLSYTGVYNQDTFDAVARFQTKYASDILTPWGDKVTKGFVYILTKKKINEIYCNTMYPLSQEDQNEIDAFRNAVWTSGASGNTGFNSGTGTTTTKPNLGALLGDSVDSIADNISDVLNGSAVVELKDSSRSVLRNAAISLFSLPQRMFDKLFQGCGYTPTLLFLILVALVIIIIKLFANSVKGNEPKSPITQAPIANTAVKDSPVIVLPGVMPDEEIIIENPEEGPEEVLVNTPDLRPDQDKKS